MGRATPKSQRRRRISVWLPRLAPAALELYTKPIEPIPPEHWREYHFDPLQCLMGDRDHPCRSEPDHPHKTPDGGRYVGLQMNRDQLGEFGRLFLDHWSSLAPRIQAKKRAISGADFAFADAPFARRPLLRLRCSWFARHRRRIDQVPQPALEPLGHAGLIGNLCMLSRTLRTFGLPCPTDLKFS